MRPAIPNSWDEEFTWIGTRDPSAFLSVPVAIEFMQEIGLERFRARSRWLATYIDSKLSESFATQPIADRSQGWYGSMAHIRLPKGDWSSLQKQLWEQIGIEVMIVQFNEEWFVRVSCHLYNNVNQLDTLIKALARLTT